MFTLTDPDTWDDQTSCSLIISLAQRVEKRKTEHSIGFRVYKVLNIDRAFGVYLIFFSSTLT